MAPTFVRILGIESSTRRGSIALVDGGVVVAADAHEQPNAHAEQLLPMIERLFASAGWSRTALDRVAVGVGPGSFTGLRVGIALAQGIALGTSRPLVGVGSLQAMASALPPDSAHPRLRCALLDARREELFTALYSADGTELVAPHAIPRAAAANVFARFSEHGDVVVLGEIAEQVGLCHAHRSLETDLPHAIAVARVGMTLTPPLVVEPHYVRDAGAVMPVLPPSPLAE